MNFLAHLYLSGDNVDVRLGNFIGDHVKGRIFDHYSPGIQKGIKLHRAIDYFTDTHPATRDVIELFREGYRKYSGVVVDVFFDHFLARYWASFSPYPLKKFTREFYYQMVQRYRDLPQGVKLFLPLLIQSNRLYSYNTVEGVGRTIEVMSRVTSLPNRTQFAVDTLNRHYSFIREQFLILFPEMIQHVKDEYGVLPSGWGDRLIHPSAIELKEDKE